MLLLLSCELRENTLQGIGQTNDLELFLTPVNCTKFDDQPVQVQFSFGALQITPFNTTFNAITNVFTQRIDSDVFAASLEQTSGHFTLQFSSGEVIDQSFTKIQFTNQNLTNCWENVSLGYSADDGDLGFSIFVVPASCQFSTQVQAQLMYQNKSGIWTSITIKSGGTYDSENYDHMTTVQFERQCVGVFTEKEVIECNNFINAFREFRTMPMKLVINYVVSGIEVSVQGSVQNYNTPKYESCMQKMDMTVFITEQQAVVSFLAKEFLLCGFTLDDVILTMEINLVSGNFSYDQKKNFSVSETLYFPQASFSLEEEVLLEMFSVEEAFYAHYFLSIYDLNGKLFSEASLGLNSTVTCFNYVNFTVSSTQICADIKFNKLMTSCNFTDSVPFTFKGMKTKEKAPPFTGDLVDVFSIRKSLKIDYSVVQNKFCMSCKDDFSGGNCDKILPSFAKFYVKNPTDALIGLESIQGADTDFKYFSVSFSTNYYLKIIIIAQSLVAAGVFVVFGSLLMYLKIQENKRNL